MKFRSKLEPRTELRGVAYVTFAKRCGVMHNWQIIYLRSGVGQKRTLRELCELMMTASSNLAMNLLSEKLGVENMCATTNSARMG